MDTSSAEHAGKGRDLCLCVNVPAFCNVFEDFFELIFLFVCLSGSST